MINSALVETEQLPVVLGHTAQKTSSDLRSQPEYYIILYSCRNGHLLFFVLWTFDQSPLLSVCMIDLVFQGWDSCVLLGWSVRSKFVSDQLCHVIEW